MRVVEPDVPSSQRCRLLTVASYFCFRCSVDAGCAQNSMWSVRKRALQNGLQEHSNFDDLQPGLACTAYVDMLFTMTSVCTPLTKIYWNSALCSLAHGILCRLCLRFACRTGESLCNVGFTKPVHNFPHSYKRYQHETFNAFCCARSNAGFKRLR